MSKQAVSVRILDKEYLVSCPDEERESLIDTARYLDRTMKEIRDSGKIVGAERIAVMAALNISHELLQNRTKDTSKGNSISKRLRNLQDKIEIALNKGQQLEL